MSIGKYHYRFIKQFMKKDLNNIKITNGVPQVVFIFWFSHSEYIPSFSIRRFASLQSLISNIKVPVIIITQENINDWEVKNNTIHEGFKYLSGNHKSDYLRAYFLYHYGGGYHDIKYREKSWENEWEKFTDSNIWIIGRKELSSDCIGYNHEKNEQWVKNKFDKLVTFGWVICRPKNEFLFELFKKINEIMQNKLHLLKTNPALNPRCSKSYNCNNNYPIRWLEIMEEISHPLMLNYINHINYTLPDIQYKPYK